MMGARLLLDAHPSEKLLLVNVRPSTTAGGPCEGEENEVLDGPHSAGVTLSLGEGAAIAFLLFSSSSHRSEALMQPPSSTSPFRRLCLACFAGSLCLAARCGLAEEAPAPRKPAVGTYTAWQHQPEKDRFWC